MEIGGKNYEISPWSIGELKLIAEQEVRLLRRQAFRDALDTLQGSDIDEGKTRVILSAMDSVLRDVVVDNMEASSWLSSPSGQVACFEEALKAKHPDIDRAEARSLFARLQVKDHVRLDAFFSDGRDLLAEIDELNAKLESLAQDKEEAGGD